jgi:antitoxin component of MazEF toxin-antitoxin module
MTAFIIDDMERSLVQHGASSLLVSVPKKWVDQQKLEKGDTVHIEQYNEKLIVRPSRKPRSKSAIKLSVTDSSYDSLQLLLSTLYRQYYETITLTYKDPKTIVNVQRICNLLHGFEIISQDEHECTISNIVSRYDLEIDALLTKIMQIVSTGFVWVREHFAVGTKGQKQELSDLHDQCWRIKNMVHANVRDSPFYAVHAIYFKIHIIEHNSSILLWLYEAFEKSNLRAATPAFMELFNIVHEFHKETTAKTKNMQVGFAQARYSSIRELLQLCEEYAAKPHKDAFLIPYLSLLLWNIHTLKSPSFSTVDIQARK